MPAITTSNEARGPHTPHRGQRPLPQQLAQAANGARFCGSGLARDYSLERSPRPTHAPSRPEAAPATARPRPQTEPDFVGAGLPAIQPRAKPAARIRRIAARGRSHNSSPEPASEPRFGGSGLARDAASNEASGSLRPLALTRRCAPPSSADAGEGHIRRRPTPLSHISGRGAGGEGERACPRYSLERSRRPASAASRQGGSYRSVLASLVQSADGTHSGEGSAWKASRRLSPQRLRIMSK